MGNKSTSLKLAWWYPPMGSNVTQGTMGQLALESVAWWQVGKGCWEGTWQKGEEPWHTMNGVNGEGQVAQGAGMSCPV